MKFSVPTLAILLALAGCTGSSMELKTSPEFAAIRSGGYRLAVMPFSVSADRDGFLTEALGGLGDLLALEAVNENAPPTTKAATVMRRAFTASLAGGPFQVADLWTIDTELTHAGFSAEARQEQENARRIAEMLDVDGVLFGDVTEWNRSYYVAQSVQRAGLRIRIFDRRKGETIYDAHRTEQQGSGISGGPTGQLSVLTSPVEGLKGSTLPVLARLLARNAARELSGVDPASEFDLASSRGDAPRIVFTSVALPGSKPLRSGEIVTVVAVGTPGAEVRFDIGRWRTGIPMIQRDVTEDPRGPRATYTGEYVVQQGEKVSQAPLFVSVRKKTDKQALRTVRRVPDAMIAIDATLSADPPR